MLRRNSDKHLPSITYFTWFKLWIFVCVVLWASLHITPPRCLARSVWSLWHCISLSHQCLHSSGNVFNWYLPPLSSPQPNSIVGPHADALTDTHTHVNRQNGHNRGTCMLAHTHRLQHQKEGGHIRLRTVHEHTLIRSETLCYYCPFIPLSIQIM